MNPSPTTRILKGGLAALFSLAALTAIWWSVTGAARAAVQAQAAPTAQPQRQERDGDLNAPLISFIENPSADCYRPVAQTDACYISWSYLNVSSAAAQYMISMTVSIDGRTRAYFGGFFQTNMYVPPELYAPGLKVACGVPGASGNPDLGNTYNYVVRARETGGLAATNYGSVTCPADTVPPASVHLAGPTRGAPFVGHSFLATVSPVTATLPISYEWKASGQVPLTLTAGLTSTQTYTWTIPGPKTIVVSAWNASGAISTTHQIIIRGGSGTGLKLFLPTVSR